MINYGRRGVITEMAIYRLMKKIIVFVGWEGGGGVTFHVYNCMLPELFPYSNIGEVCPRGFMV